MRKQLIFIGLFAIISFTANSSILHNNDWKIAINPKDFGLTILTNSKDVLLTKQSNHKVSNYSKKNNTISWSWPDKSLDFEIALSNKNLIIKIKTDKKQTFRWLNQQVNYKPDAYILPLDEGAFVPVGNKDWMNDLDNSEYNTESDLSMPFWSQVYSNFQLNFTLINPYNNTLTFKVRDKSLTLNASHDFVKIDKSPIVIVITLNKNKNFLSGAKEYRHILKLANRFVPLSKKLKKVNNGSRILGASQIYIWGDDIFGFKDIKDIPGLVQWLKSDQGKIVYSKLSNNVQSSLSKFVQKKADIYLKYSFISELNSALYEIAVPNKKSPTIKDEFLNSEKTKALTNKLIGRYLTDTKLWGNGFSTPLVEKLHKSGLKKLWLAAATDWKDCLLHPEAIKLANSYGYLTSAYDSYNTAVPDNSGWRTAEMGEDIIKNGAIIDKNGKPLTGFNGRGVYTNPGYVNNYMKSRITDVLKYTNINSYFLDVEATAWAFNDYSPKHTTTKPEMIELRNNRLGWIEKKFKIPVGSEGGNVLTSKNTIYAQGLALSSVGYWDNGNIFKKRKSKYYLGNYYPSQEPTLYFKPMPNMLKAVYTVDFDPVYKLPLYQIVLHDSVIISNHWGYGMLKFPSLQKNQMLKTLLYMNAPLYHLNWNTLDKRIPVIVKFDKIFRPLHERLATVQMTNFKYLSKDKLVQSTYFADGTQIIVNFSNDKKIIHIPIKGNNVKNKKELTQTRSQEFKSTIGESFSIDAYTMMAKLPNGKAIIYTV
ncbi:MAG: hypothetical protein GY756_01675 [bacterium]|nr:hypothetical protein [bacterium]